MKLWSETPQAPRRRPGQAERQADHLPAGEAAEGGAGGPRPGREAAGRGEEEEEDGGGHRRQSRGLGRRHQVPHTDCSRQSHTAGGSGAKGSTRLPSNRLESTDSLRGRIRELESECKKLSMDVKLKEEQIRDLEGKCQVSRKEWR